MDSQQEIFTALRTRIKALGLTVYDGALPPASAEYPFVYLGESTVDDSYNNKTVISGEALQVIHVWHDRPDKRGTLSRILLNIKEIARGIRETDTYHWFIVGVDQRILPDDSTSRTLLHGILELRWRFY